MFNWSKKYRINLSIWYNIFIVHIKKSKNLWLVKGNPFCNNGLQTGNCTEKKCNKTLKSLILHKVY